MYYNSGNHDYEDYLKALENRISPKETENTVSEKPKNQKKKSRRYRVVRIRPAALLVLVLIIGVVVLTVATTGRKLRKAKVTVPQAKSISDEEYTSSNVIANEKKPKPVTFSFTADTAAIPDTNDAESAVVVNTETNEIVASREAEKRMYPASTTKIMTLLTAVENIKDYNDTFTMTLDITDPLYVAEATVAGFLNGETINMTDMLYGTILPSGADAAIGLAIKIAGGEKEFVSLMNKKAEDLGLKNTHFTNVTGLFDADHYSTAYDMALILNAAIKNPKCREILSTYKYTTSKTAQHPDGIELSSTLFSYMYGTEPETATITGGKTGFVNESGYCIASFGESNSMHNEYIAVTFKNSARWPAFYGQIDLYKQFAK